MRRVLLAMSFAGAISGLFYSCSRENSGARSHSFQVYQENGVIVAETEGGPKFPGILFAFEKVLEIHPPNELSEAYWQHLMISREMRMGITSLLTEFAAIHGS